MGKNKKRNKLKRKQNRKDSLRPFPDGASQGLLPPIHGKDTEYIFFNCWVCGNPHHIYADVLKKADILIVDGLFCHKCDSEMWGMVRIIKKKEAYGYVCYQAELDQTV